MQITIERMNGENFQLVVEEEETVATVKMRISENTFIDPYEQRLIFQEQLLVDYETISFYNIQEGSVIYLSHWSTPEARKEV